MGRTSFVRNCIIRPRKEGETLFYGTADGEIIPMLEGYTILPNEEYDELLEKSGMKEQKIELVYYCPKCGARCLVREVHQRYDTRTGKSIVHRILTCPNAPTGIVSKGHTRYYNYDMPPCYTD